MLVAKDSDGRRTIGYRARRGRDYFCPRCGEKVISRFGAIRIPHFAHLAESRCSYLSGETELHRRMKRYLDESYSRSPYVRAIEIEFPLRDVVADFYLVCADGRRVAIECQVTRIDERDLMRRTVAYSRLGIHVLWLLAGRDELDRCIARLKRAGSAALPYSATEIEKRLQKLYYGRFYYFFNGRIYPVHMEPAERWMRSSCEGCSREGECTAADREECEIYTPGYMRKMRKKQEVSVGLLRSLRPLCILSRGGLRLARFMDRRWWGTAAEG